MKGMSYTLPSRKKRLQSFPLLCSRTSTIYRAKIIHDIKTKLQLQLVIPDSILIFTRSVYFSTGNRQYDNRVNHFLFCIVALSCSIISFYLVFCKKIFPSNPFLSSSFQTVLSFLPRVQTHQDTRTPPLQNPQRHVPVL